VLLSATLWILFVVFHSQLFVMKIYHTALLVLFGMTVFLMVAVKVCC